MEVLMAQLVGCFSLSTEEAMKSELHRSCMSIINSRMITEFLNLYIICDTYVYSTEIADPELKLQSIKLNGIAGARNSKFKNVEPYVGMNPDLLVKYRIGLRFSIVGKLQSHPVFYSPRVEEHYNVDLNDISSKTLNKIVPFPEFLEDSIDFAKERFTT